MRIWILCASLCAGGMWSLTVSAAGNHGAHSAEHAHAAGPSPIGEAGRSDRVDREVQVTLRDTMRFEPAHIQVRAGETVRFKLHNAGRLRHEFVLGTPQDLAAHAQVMQQMPDMAHDAANQASLPPGGRAEVVWRFTQAGTVDFACLQPYHLEAGMKGQVRVATASPTPKAAQ